jgi:hypothetical protein
MLPWKPIAQPPAQSPCTALLRETDPEGGQHLHPGPLMWDAARGAWCSETSGQPVRLRPGVTYHWILEDEVLA